MLSGKMVVIDEGDLATAMRASMAIPGAFAPVATEEYMLSDGGLVRNIPIDVARELCADVVIVVNLVEPRCAANGCSRPTQLFGRTMDVMIEANEQLQLQSLRPDDVRIDVFMGDITTADFERVPETIPLGEAAARQMAGALRRYAVPSSEYVAWRSQRDVVAADRRAYCPRCVWKGSSTSIPIIWPARGEVKAGDSIDTARISQEAQRMSALRDFERVGYRLEGDLDAPALVWLPQEKRLGARLPEVRSRHVCLGRRRRDLRDLQQAQPHLAQCGGLESSVEVQLGGETLLSGSLLQPLDAAHRWFVEPRAFWRGRSRTCSATGSGSRATSLRTCAGQLDIGVKHRRRGASAAGLPLQPPVGRSRHRLAVAAGAGVTTTPASSR